MAVSNVNHLYCSDRFTISSVTGSSKSNDCLQVLNYLAGGREVGSLVTVVCQSVLARPASIASKKLAYDVAKTAALSSDDWDAACEGLRADVAGSHSPEVWLTSSNCWPPCTLATGVPMMQNATP